MGKKIDVKVKFTVVIKNVFNLDAETEGKEIWVAWKRGKKNVNKGETKKVTVSGKIGVIGETVNIQSTLCQDEKTKEFDEKKLELFVKEVWSNHLELLIYIIISKGKQEAGETNRISYCRSRGVWGTRRERGYPSHQAEKETERGTSVNEGIPARQPLSSLWRSFSLSCLSF